MPIVDIIIPYPDFIMGEMIDPEQFDLNNQYIVEKIDETIGLLNKLTDGAGGESGAGSINMNPIAPLLSVTLQSYLEEFNLLLTTGEDNKGSDFIGSKPIAGVTGNTVLKQLTSLKSIFDTLKTDIDTRVKQDILTLQINKVGRDEVYDRATMDAKLLAKVNQSGNFTGTWHGMKPSDAASETINGGRLDVLEPQVFYLLSVVQTLDMIKRELANLKLYQDANDRVPNGILFGTKFDDTFGMEIDFTKTATTAEVLVGATYIDVVTPFGFITGQEVTLYDDVSSETVMITSFNGNRISITPTVHAYKTGAGFARTMADLDAVGLKLDFADWQGTKLLYNDIRFALELPYSSLAMFITHGDGMTFGGEINGVEYTDKTLEGVVNVAISEVV